jgi:hypothetical protein
MMPTLSWPLANGNGPQSYTTGSIAQPQPDRPPDASGTTQYSSTQPHKEQQT